MPLFGKKYNFKDDGLMPDSNRYRHLDLVGWPNKVLVREPDMKGNGTTVVVLPHPDFEHNAKAADPKQLKVLPDRYSADPQDYSPWIFYGDGMRRFGKTGVTLFFDNPDDSGFIPTEHHPVHLIYESVFRAVKAGVVVETPFGSSAPESDNWALLLNGGNDNKTFRSINRPTRLFAMYVLVYSAGKEDYYGQPGNIPLGAAKGENPVVFVMSDDTCKSFVRAADELRPGAPGGAMEDYLHPTVTGGRFVHFFDRKAGTCPAMANARNAQSAAAEFGGERRRAPAAGGIAGGQGKAELAGYDVFISATLDGRPDGTKAPRERIVQMAAERLRPWDEVLRGWDPKSCARIVAERCGLPRSILYHAWKSMREYYPDDLKHGLRAPVSQNFRQPAAHGGDAGWGDRPAADPAGDDGTFPLDAVPDMGPAESDGGGFGAPPPVGRQADPGDAPWGGNVNDPPAAGPADVYDPQVQAAAQARLREHQRRQQAGADVARSQAGRPPR